MRAFPGWDLRKKGTPSFLKKEAKNFCSGAASVGPLRWTGRGGSLTGLGWPNLEKS
jgi:hypothetical protein